MSCAASFDIEICKNKDYVKTLRWEASPFVYKTISAIQQSAPVRLTVTGHGIPDGWRVAISDVKGMTDINALNSPPRASDFHRITVIDANTIEINTISAKSYRAYTSGGVVRYYTPVSLAGYTAELVVKDKVDGTTLATWTSKVTINDTNKKITINIPAADTAALTWLKGVYELVLISGTGVRTGLIGGRVVVTEDL